MSKAGPQGAAATPAAATPASQAANSSRPSTLTSGAQTLSNKAASAAPPAKSSAPPPNAWTARSKLAREQAAAAAAAAASSPAASGASTPTSTSAPAPATSTAAAPTATASNAKASSPNVAAAQPQSAAANAAPSAGASTATTASSAVRSLESLLGKPLKITSNTGSVAQGLLWCFDSSSGTVVLETGLSPTTCLASPADLTSTPYSAALSAGQRRTDISAPRSGFRILKARDVRAVDVLSQATADSLGLPREISVIDTSVANTAAAEAREQAAVRDIQTKAAKVGKGVSALGQSIFDALSKTMNCRWHEQHIIVMEEVVIHGPQYDGPSTTVPGLTADQLRALSEGSTPASLPPLISPTEAKAKANSWSRVVKVLDGERKRIQARQVATPA